MHEPNTHNYIVQLVIYITQNKVLVFSENLHCDTCHPNLPFHIKTLAFTV